MNSSDSDSKFPIWLFVVADLALLAAAAFIATKAPQPLTSTSMILIVTCVGIGAIVLLVPLIMRYERSKNETLDDRQRALEALAATITATAEQISIAAAGLHEIAASAQKNFRQAEQLPHKLQEKIAEFQAHLAAAEDTEKEELERELLALRTSESERLDTVSQRIAKSAADWSKLEQSMQQHLVAAQEALTKLSLGTASGIGKAQAAAEQALMQARVEAARAVGEVAGKATKSIETAQREAFAQLEAKVATTAAVLIDKPTEASRPNVASALPEPRENATDTNTDTHSETAAATAIPADVPRPVAIPPDGNGTAEATALVAPVRATARVRKTRREEGPADPAASQRPATAGDSTPAPSSGQPVEATAPADRPSPVIIGSISGDSAPSPSQSTPVNGAARELVTQMAGASVDAAAAGATNGMRKRAVTTVEPSAFAPAEPGLGLNLDDPAVSGAASISDGVSTSDGATRLIVKAYIGIGNRLFIRGEGPGLSWEKGLPLQFVSIGKWRWESNGASSPVRFKLYKNDELECSALGEQTLDPGHQQEVTAAF